MESARSSSPSIPLAASRTASACKPWEIARPASTSRCSARQGSRRGLAQFFAAFEGMYEGFTQRAAEVKRLLSSKEAAFVLVTSANPLTIEEALFFHRALAGDGVETAAVVVNRVHRDPHRFSGPDSVPALREALTLSQIKDGGDPPLSQRPARTLPD